MKVADMTSKDMTVPKQFKEVLDRYTESQQGSPNVGWHGSLVVQFLQWVGDNQPSNLLDSESDWHNAAECYYLYGGRQPNVRVAVQHFTRAVSGPEVLVRHTPPYRYQALVEEFRQASLLEYKEVTVHARVGVARRFLWWVVETGCADTALTADGWPQACKNYEEYLALGRFINAASTTMRDETARLRAFGRFLKMQA